MRKTSLKIVDDINEALRNKDTFWLNLSVLFFVVVLPFNAFGFKLLAIDYFHVKFTKIALLFVFIFGLKVYFQKKLLIQRANLLYFFLILQILANLLSTINSPNPKESLLLAITVSQYSVLVFILINVLRTEALLKAILEVMGMVVLLIIGHSFIIWLLQGGAFNTRLQPSIVGNNIAQYLAYVVLMYGAGLLYLFFSENTKRPRCFLFIFVVLWLCVTIFPSVKIFQIVTLLFLSLLMVTLNGRRKKVLLLITLYILMFGIQYHMITIKNKVLGVEHAIRSQIIRVIKPMEPQPVIPALLDESCPGSQVKNRWVTKGSFALRVRGIVTGLFMGSAFPWTGVGVGQTRYYFNHFSNIVREKSNDPSFLPHLPFRKHIFTDKEYTIESISIFNIFMNAWAETGIFGIVAILGILITIIIHGFLGIWKTRRSETGTSLDFLFPLLLAVLLAHQTLYLWCHPWLWTIIALTFASSQVSHSHVSGCVQ